MYTLLSAGVLALDLARHPAGVAVSDVTDRVLALSGEEVAALVAASARRPDPAALRPARSRLLARAAAVPRARDVLPRVSAGLARPAPAGEVAALGAVLTASLLGGLTDLHALLLRERPLVALPAPAAQCALDAVTAAWAGPGSDPSDVALLSRSWEQARSPLPPPLPEDAYGSGGAAGLRVLLDEVARLSADGWSRVVTASDAAHRGLSWSTSVSEACALVPDGRTAAVARAHLAAARALRLSVASTGPRAGTAAMAVAAAVQATCLLDLLPAASARRLLQPWEAGSTRP